MARGTYQNPDFELLAREVGKVSEGLAKLAGNLSAHTSVFSRSAAAINNSAKELQKAMGAGLPSTIAKLSAGIAGMIPGMSLLSSQAAIAGAGIAALTAAVNPELFRIMGQMLQVAVLPALNALMPVINVFMDFLAKLGGVVENLAGPLNQLAVALAPIIDAAMDLGLVAFQMLGQIFLLGARMIAPIVAALEPAFNFLIGIMGTFARVVEKAAPILISAMTVIVNSIRSILETIGRGVAQFAQFFVNGMINVINAIIRAVNYLLSYIGLEGFGELRAPDLVGGLEAFIDALAAITNEGKNLRDSMKQEAQKRKEAALASFGPKGGLTSLESVWGKMMQASLGETPLERERRMMQIEGNKYLKDIAANTKPKGGI